MYRIENRSATAAEPVCILLNCSWLNNNDFITNEACEQKPLFKGFYVMRRVKPAAR